MSLLRKFLILVCCFLLLWFIGPWYLLLSGQVKTGRDWRTASRSETKVLAPYHIGKQAAVILLDANAFNWRGMFSTHSWLAVKKQGQERYTIYQVLGWNKYRNKPIVDVSHGQPDRLWFGDKPKVRDIMLGKRAEQFIPKIAKAVAGYPYSKTYVAFPGPNSNTFIAYVLQQVPALKFSMPYNALGRDFGFYFSTRHVNLWGLLGYHLEAHVFYINFMGLTAGFTTQPFAWIVPGMGRID